jgi:hypothetical protein
MTERFLLDTNGQLLTAEWPSWMQYRYSDGELYFEGDDLFWRDNLDDPPVLVQVGAEAVYRDGLFTIEQPSSG